MEIYGEWAIIERFVLEFNSMVVETKGIWIASWLVIGRKIEGRKWFFLHYNWKKAKAEDIPLVFSFFPSTFIPSRLHIVACPDIKDRLWKDDTAYFWKNFLFLFNPWCMPGEIYFRNSRKRWLYLHKSAFLSSYSSSHFPLPVKISVKALIWSRVVKDDSFNPNLMKTDGMSDNTHTHTHTHPPFSYIIDKE
jgi:hypothetical protein